MDQHFYLHKFNEQIIFQVFCRAFIGAPLKDNEFLKLEHTHLAGIVLDEEGNLRNIEESLPELSVCTCMLIKVYCNFPSFYGMCIIMWAPIHEAT